MINHFLLSKTRIDTNIVKALIAKQGKSISEFAKERGLSKQTVYNFLNGTGKTNPKIVKKIYDGLGMDLSELKACSDEPDLIKNLKLAVLNGTFVTAITDDKKETVKNILYIYRHLEEFKSLDILKDMPYLPVIDMQYSGRSSLPGSSVENRVVLTVGKIAKKNEIIEYIEKLIPIACNITSLKSKGKGYLRTYDILIDIAKHSDKQKNYDYRTKKKYVPYMEACIAALTQYEYVSEINYLVDLYKGNYGLYRERKNK